MTPQAQRTIDRGRTIALIAWSVTGVYWAALFVATHLPPTRLPKTRITDTPAHFTSYAILAALLLWSLHFTRLSLRAAAWWVIGIGLVYGVIDEILQIFVGRICSLSDWLADASGVITVVATWTAVSAVRYARSG